MLPFQRPKPQQEVVEKFSLTLEKNCRRRRSFSVVAGAALSHRGGGKGGRVPRPRVPSHWRGGFTNPPAFLGLPHPQPFLVTQLITDGLPTATQGWGRSQGLPGGAGALMRTRTGPWLLAPSS